MSKLYTIENGKLIPVETPGNLDIAAAKLTNDPVYGTLVSSDVSQTKEALVYLVIFAMLPLVLVVKGTLENFGWPWLVAEAVYLITGYIILRNIWVFGLFYAASLFAYFKWIF